MPVSNLRLKEVSKISKYPMFILMIVFAFGIFIVGYDQGHTFSIVQGEKAFDQLWMHEFVHDLRHSAGFPCH